MTWFNAHWWQLLVGWGVLNSCILAPISSQVPTTTWYGKALHAFVGISPMDVLKVVKAYGAQAVPPTLGVLCLALLACGAQPPPPAVLNTTAEQVAVAAYAEEQANCDARATSHKDGELCILSVKVWWCTHGLPSACPDGGLPTDGGGQ
jgi:hypothetical protein